MTVKGGYFRRPLQRTMSRILVTGGAGFVPSEVAVRLAQYPAKDVVAVDKLLTGDIRMQPLDQYPHLHFINCDATVFNDHILV